MDIQSLYHKYLVAASAHIPYSVDYNDFIITVNHICDYADECESWVNDLFTADELEYILLTLAG